MRHYETCSDENRNEKSKEVFKYIMGPMEIIICVAVAVLTLIVGFAAGVVYRKRIAESKIGTAEGQAAKIVDEARKAGEPRADCLRL